MELRQLEYLVAAADHGGFTRGARAVRVSQPAMSQAIASLEREVGIDLFVRTGRSVRLTPAGETVVERARHVLREMADLGSDMAALKGLHVGRIDVVALPTLAVDPLATVLGELRRVHPGIPGRLAAAEGWAAVRQG